MARAATVNSGQVAQCTPCCGDVDLSCYRYKKAGTDMACIMVVGWPRGCRKVAEMAAVVLDVKGGSLSLVVSKLVTRASQCFRGSGRSLLNRYRCSSTGRHRYSAAQNDKGAITKLGSDGRFSRVHEAGSVARCSTAVGSRAPRVICYSPVSRRQLYACSTEVTRLGSQPESETAKD